ncbi:protein of unknown function [Methanoculleus bourgensis]|uniref:Uncharacterized protein n=1 Tax=Methanoculleus bourgensis TaxID=83986 RepID=A0A0X8XZZ9_9EURY|nr:protein of unknown function [Methanoculleus bourgensis]
MDDHNPIIIVLNNIGQGSYQFNLTLRR